MTEPQTDRSPLVRLVLFIVCLAIAGSIAAGVLYYVAGLPQQQNGTVPVNSCGADCPGRHPPDAYSIYCQMVCNGNPDCNDPVCHSPG